MDADGSHMDSIGIQNFAGVGVGDGDVFAKDQESVTIADAVFAATGDLDVLAASNLVDDDRLACRDFPIGIVPELI